MPIFTADLFSDIKSDFGAKVPSVLFREPSTGLKYQLGVNSGAASNTTQLLNTYAAIDPRVRQLAIVFRYWAKVGWMRWEKDKGSHVGKRIA